MSGCTVGSHPGWWLCSIQWAIVASSGFRLSAKISGTATKERVAKLDKIAIKAHRTEFLDAISQASNMVLTCVHGFFRIDSQVDNRKSPLFRQRSLAPPPLNDRRIGFISQLKRVSLSSRMRLLATSTSSNLRRGNLSDHLALVHLGG